MKQRFTKKLSPVLILSGLVIAVSFVVMLVPLAIFCVAQTAAMLGKKTAFLLMFVVSLVMVLFGTLISSQLIMGSGILVLISIPFFMTAIYLREKKYHPCFAAGVLLLPVVLSFSIIAFAPFHDAQFLNELDKSAEQLKALVDWNSIREFFGYTYWQRILWFVFGAGAFSFFASLLVSFANLALVDLAFEQADKIRAIVNYVNKNQTRFPYEIVQMFGSLPVAKSHRLNTPIVVLDHAHMSGAATKTSKWLGFLKSPQPQNVMAVKDYLFFFEQTRSKWNLKKFALPFPLVIVAILFMGSVAFFYGNFEHMVLAMSTGVPAAVVSLASAFSFALLSILTLQGMYTFYIRFSSFFALCIFFCFFILGSSFSFGPYALLAFFGTVSILDYVYDWRRRKS